MLRWRSVVSSMEKPVCRAHSFLSHLCARSRAVSSVGTYTGGPVRSNQAAAGYRKAGWALKAFELDLSFVSTSHSASSTLWSSCSESWAVGIGSLTRRSSG
eukprot:scaffold398_cov206-Pinguiococcus_pyrenoidosus.AAC.6